MGTVVLCLGALASAVISLAAGMTWQRLLHWIGELLLILGVLLAAKGISDVRREWTRLPGLTKSAMLLARSARDSVVSFLWLCWNRRLEEWPWLARWPGLRKHETYVPRQDANVVPETVLGKVYMPPVRVDITGGDTEQRLMQLEKRLAELEGELGALRTWRVKEIKARQAETAQERAERMAEDESIRGDMADLVGGGLRLQAWGVVCLLLGTILTAFW
jgi:hypothetical protein